MDLGRQSPLGSACHPTAFCIKGGFLLCLFTPLNFFQVKPGEFFQVFTFLEGGEEVEPSTRSVLQPQCNTKISFTTRPPLECSILGARLVTLKGSPPGSAGTESLGHSLIWAVHLGRIWGASHTSSPFWSHQARDPGLVTCQAPPLPRSSVCLKRKHSRFQGATGRHKSWNPV